MNFSVDKIPRKIYRKIRRLIHESNFRELSVFYCRNIFSHEECYMTCSGKRDGAGAQTQAIMSTMLFADVMHLKYVHTPIVELQHKPENESDWEGKWERFFNMGKGELRTGDDSVKISQKITLESPFKIRKKANTLFILRHCHDYADMFPDRYRRIKKKLIDKYYATSKSGYELHYDPQKVNVAVHIRRGDVTSSEPDRFTPNSFIVATLKNILNIIHINSKKTSICVYSEGKIEEFKAIEQFNPKFFLNDCPFTTFHNLVCADVLLMAKSTFSYTAALLSKGIIFYEYFRHQPQNSWIKVNKHAEFDAKKFARKLRDNNQIAYDLHKI